jgi:hypothetical protein
MAKTRCTTDATAVIGEFNLAHGHRLDGSPMVRSLGEIVDLIEARARALDVSMIARRTLELDDQEGAELGQATPRVPASERIDDIVQRLRKRWPSPRHK